MKKIVLKLNLHDDKGKKKALKAVTTLSGIDQIAIDMKERKLTVVGTVDVIYLVRKLRKFWPTEILFVGPAEEPERREEAKKEEAKKEDPKEEDPKKEEPEKEEPKKEEPKKAESEKKEEPKRAESEKKEEPKKAESEKPKKKEINPYEQMIMDLVKGYQHTILRLSTLTTYTVQRRIPMLALFAAKISVQQVYI